VESGGNGEEWSPTAEVGNLLSGEIIIMTRNRSMARSDLRSRLETASRTVHTLYLAVFRESKSEPSRVRACVRACVSRCAQERIRARGYGEPLLSRG